MEADGAALILAFLLSGNNKVGPYKLFLLNQQRHIALAQQRHIALAQLVLCKQPSIAYSLNAVYQWRSLPYLCHSKSLT